MNLNPPSGGTLKGASRVIDFLKSYTPILLFSLPLSLLILNIFRLDEVPQAFAGLVISSGVGLKEAVQGAIPQGVFSGQDALSSPLLI